MTRARHSIVSGVIAATLVACEGGQHPVLVAAPAPGSAPPGSRATRVLEGRPSAGASAHKRYLLPTDTGVTLSFGRFGDPCDLQNDATTRVVMLRCARVGAREEAGITVNFYLPGVWSSEPFTAEDVAALIRDSPSTNGHVEGAFGAPDPVTGKLAYFLVTSAVYPDTDQGQVFLMKVAPLEDAVYAVFYTTMFRGEQSDALRARIRAWLLEHLTEYHEEIAGLTPDPSWLAYWRSRLREERAR